MIYCCNYFPNDTQPSDPEDVTHFLLDLMRRTTLPDESIDDAIKRSCTSDATCIPVICPSTTLMLTTYYLDRLQRKYGHFCETFDDAQRVFVVMYLIAAKYIRANVQWVVGASHAAAAAEEREQEKKNAKYEAQQQQVGQSEAAPDETADDDVDRDAARLVTALSGGFMANPPDARLLTCLELEVLQFLDYHLQLHRTSADLWPWFNEALHQYEQRFCPYQGPMTPPESTLPKLPVSPFLSTMDALQKADPRINDAASPPATSTRDRNSRSLFESDENGAITLPPLSTAQPHQHHPFP
ncbi:hypothetical protein BC940DRAFT_298033 [Gongronella butleri]|nr:hypothetical protein BC940DRAFT_298033 [Gongronella butleri]